MVSRYVADGNLVPRRVSGGALGLRAHAAREDDGTGVILTVARVMEAALAFVAIFVAVRSPRHRVFAAWVTLSLCYSLADHLVIVPVLTALPKPYTGSGRFLFHASQLLFVAVAVGFAHVVFELVRVRRLWRPLPWFLGFVAMVVLVDGYGHSPGRGLYQIAGLVFRSSSVYITIEIAVNALVMGTLLPRWRSLIDENRSTDDFAVLASVLAIQAGGIVQLVVHLAPNFFPTYAVPLGSALAYAIALGFHAPVVFLHVLGDRSPEYRLRNAIARRREAIHEMSWRLEASRAAFTEACRDGHPGPAAFPTTTPLVLRAGLSVEFVALVVEDLVIAGGVDFVLSIVWGLGAQDAAALLGQVDESIREAARNGQVDGAEEFPWAKVFEESAAGPRSFLGPISLTVFSMQRGLSWDQARRTVGFARKVAERVASGERATGWSGARG